MSRPPDPPAPASGRRGCPMCGRAPVPRHAPFCSATCRDRDLIAWLDGRYALPGPPGEPPEEGG